MRAAGWTFLTSITLGAALPWREAALERYKMQHCYYGDLRGSFEGSETELFKRGWWLWLAAILLFVLAIPVSAAKSSLPPGAGGAIFGLLALVWVVALPFIYGAFKAIEWRWWISGIRFGEVSFKSDLSGAALYGLYWKVIGWFLLILLLFIAYLVTCYWWIVGFADMAHFANRLQASLTIKAATVLGYLGFILAVNIVLRIYLQRDLWARVAASSTAYGLEAVENVAAKGELANALGEGLAGGLDVVGF
jgi:uncharacterized membrane protein YjgN (DUF898 family)